MRRARNGKSDDEIAQKDLANQQSMGPNGPHLGQCDLRNIPGLDILRREKGGSAKIRRGGVVRDEGQQEERRWGQSCGKFRIAGRGWGGDGSSGKASRT
jgi:hypothetical protein